LAFFGAQIQAGKHVGNMPADLFGLLVTCRMSFFAFQASPKPVIICCHISAGLQPSAAIWAIMFRIMPDII
jgi:hypothetical protein